MSQVTADQTILGYFNTQWNRKTPIAWENLKYTPSSDTPYVEVRHRPAISTQRSLGTNIYKYAGFVSFNVYYPQQLGTQPALALIDDIETIFKDPGLEAFHFYPATIERVGEMEGWYVINITIPYKMYVYPS